MAAARWIWPPHCALVQHYLSLASFIGRTWRDILHIFTGGHAAFVRI